MVNIYAKLTELYPTGMLQAWEKAASQHLAERMSVDLPKGYNSLHVHRNASKGIAFLQAASL